MRLQLHNIDVKAVKIKLLTLVAGVAIATLYFWTTIPAVFLGVYIGYQLKKVTKVF